ncbi:hypothetical protein D3C80_622150 [compost metagenome]
MQRLQAGGDDEAVAYRKMQPAEIARFLVEFPLEIDKRAIERFFIDHDGRMCLMGGEACARCRIETVDGFEKTRHALIGEIEMQPEEAFALGHFVKAGIGCKPAARGCAGVELIGPDKARNNWRYEIHRGSPDRLDGRREAPVVPVWEQRRRRATFSAC